MDTRTVDLSEVIHQLSQAFPTLSEVHLFGSRLYKTGSVRSDIDLLVEFAPPFPPIGQIGEWLAVEPYVDLFVMHGNSATSAINGSQIVCASRSGLLEQLHASPLWREAKWIGDEHRHHRVIDSWAPVPTVAAPGASPIKPIDIPPPCDYLIVSALAKEHDAVRRELTDARHWSPAGGIAPSFEVALVHTERGRTQHVAAAVFPRIGMAPAALTTKSLVDFLAPKLVILVGIAGGISPHDVSLGDLVIPDAIFDYEAVKVTADGEQSNAMIAPVSSAAYQSIKEGGWSNWTSKRAKLRPHHGWLRRTLGRVTGSPLPKLRIHFDGPMASGHKVIADSERGLALRAIHRKTASIDMESWGAAEACAFSRNPTPFIVVKAISDYADAKKNDEWHAFCCQTSAAFAIELIRRDIV
jgi:nucleoside phosphorylase